MIFPPIKKLYNKQCGLLFTANIAGRDVEIWRVEQPIDESGKKCFALYWFDDKRIEIANYFDDETEQKLLIHELAHASLHLFKATPKTKEEKLCNIIEAGVHAGLKPWLKPLTKTRNKKVRERNREKQ